MSLTPLVVGTGAWAAFEAALRCADLPAEDLLDAGQLYFASGTSAFGGFALSERVALLCSIVVGPARRRAGLGSVLLEGLLEEVRTAGAGEAWLLTTSAAGFFTRHGFMPKTRGEAIAASPQFTRLCPSTAVLMCRVLS